MKYLGNCSNNSRVSFEAIEIYGFVRFRMPACLRSFGQSRPFSLSQANKSSYHGPLSTDCCLCIKSSFSIDKKAHWQTALITRLSLSKCYFGMPFVFAIRE